jgi:hypothetical protein
MMYQSDAEILYPNRVTSTLRELRGGAWRQLVDNVLSRPEGDAATLAFTLMMIRLDGCLTCHADSYRAMRGCALCAQHTIERYKGTDEQLLAAFQQAQSDILLWHQTGEVPFSEQLPQEVQLR